MTGDIKSSVMLRACGIVVAAIGATVILANVARATPPGPHHSFLTGPWELVVKMGHEGSGLRFPLKVVDEDKPEKLDSILPVMGTPITVKLEQYLPDLLWETRAIEQAGGEIVAKLTIEGKDLNQDVWLSTGDPERQSVSSSIGGIAIRRLYDANTVEKLMRDLAKPKAVGIVSVWAKSTDTRLEYAASVGGTIVLPKSKYKVNVLRYIPHYSIDTETKKVVSRSEKPINPAIEVRVDDGKAPYEQWLWSKFPSFAHEQIKYALRMEFTDFDLGGTEGRYILAVAAGSEPWLLFSRKGKSKVKKATFGKPYLFADEGYTFNIEKIFESAVVETAWKNNSEKLLHPAIVVTIEQNDIERRAVLEFNKPYHYKTKFGTMVLLYRRQPGPSKIAN